MKDKVKTLTSMPIKNWLPKEKALLICIVITLMVMVLEFVFSYISHSLMLFSDGVHMFTHALSLIITLISILIAKKIKNKSVELIAVTINGMMLFYFGLFIFFESIDRIITPEPINISYTVGIACIGLVVNLFTAYLLYQSGIEDLNTKSAFAHMMADTLMSVAIVVGAGVIYFTNFYVIDALLSIIVSILVMKWAFDLLNKIARILRLTGAAKKVLQKKPVPQGSPDSVSQL